MKNQIQRHSLIVPFFAALLVLGIFWACKKGNSSTSSQNPTIAFITSSTWKYDTSGIDLNNDGQVDIGDTVLAPCVKDNTYTFMSDSTGTMDEGPTKCSPSAPQTDPLKWYLTNNSTVLNITSNTILNGNLNILSINSSNWTLYKDTAYGGLSFRYLFILKH